MPRTPASEVIVNVALINASGPGTGPSFRAEMGELITPHFAITPAQGGVGGWTLTHIPSGYGARTSGNQAALRALARCLEPCGGWDFTDPLEVKKVVGVSEAFAKWHALKVSGNSS